MVKRVGSSRRTCLWVVRFTAAACGLGPEAGDTMQPLGMHGQSKISDLLGEAGVPVESRSMMPIVRTNIRGHVVWVAGIRPDERVKCTQDTKQLLELNIYSGHKPFGEEPVMAELHP